MASYDMAGFIEIVKNRAEELDSEYRDKTRDTDELYEFLEGNDWFGTLTEDDDGCSTVTMNKELEKRLDIWLLSYRKSDTQKREILLGLLEERYPRTASRFRKYVAGKKTDRSQWIVLDVLLASMTKELDEYSDDEIKELITDSYEELQLINMKFFAGFLNYEADGEAFSPWKYSFKSHQIVKPDNTAYGIEGFALMAYIVLNEESWADNKLVEKALENERWAELWLFTALHFICALRTTDMLRLPVPSLPYSGEEIRRRISEGTFTVSDGKKIAFEVQYRCRMRSSVPNKTKKHGLVPEIKFFIPESLMEPLGFIMAIALSFHEDGEPFVRTDFTIRNIISFFGDDFADALGFRNFRSRRANKAYLQGIEAVADDDDESRAKGYMLAALARSHKGGIGTLPEITDVYLRDANFTGYSPEFILMEMFERGVFGFVPSMLLEMYKGREYKALGVSDQTKLIKEVGLDAWQIEAVAESVAVSYARAGDIVESTLAEAGGKENALPQTLHRIASAAAPSKQDECMCLRTAAGLNCICPGRDCCLGCGFEIYTKSALELLVREYSRLRATACSEDADAERARGILKHYVIPSIMQILSSMEMLYPDAEMEVLKEVVERGMRNGTDDRS